MTPGEMIAELRALHTPTLLNFHKVKQCEHCAELCHSHSGLMCDDTDGQYPCPTIQIVERYERYVSERFGQTE